MTTMNLAHLAALLEGKGRKVWQPPTLDDFGIGRVMAFDQSLSATGMVLVNRTPDMLAVTDAASYSGVPQDLEATGREKDLQRGVHLWAIFSGLFRSLAPEIVLVHEAPPLGAGAGGAMRTPESSIMSAQALRIAARQHSREILMVGPRQHRKLICGNANAKKREEHEAMATLARNLGFLGMEYVTNESKRDAFCVALALLLLLGRAQKESEAS